MQKGEVRISQVLLYSALLQLQLREQHCQEYRANEQNARPCFADFPTYVSFLQIRKLFIPAKEGYGAGGFPAWGIPPNGSLDFEIEVLSLKKN
jgi:hypothetical protein